MDGAAAIQADACSVPQQDESWETYLREVIRTDPNPKVREEAVLELGGRESWLFLRSLPAPERWHIAFWISSPAVLVVLLNEMDYDREHFALTYLARLTDCRLRVDVAIQARDVRIRRTAFEYIRSHRERERVLLTWKRGKRRP